MPSAAVYVRVSTDKQTTSNQLERLRRIAEQRKYEATVFEEVESGAKRRPVLEKMIARAKSGEFAAVIVWALDRFGRGGPLETLMLLEDLDRAGVAVISAQESWLDTGGPARDLLAGIFGWVARQERHRLIERTNAGLARARAEGKQLGRPPVSSMKLGIGARAHNEGASIRKAAKLAGTSEASLRRHLASLRNEKGAAGALPAAPASKTPPRPT